MSVYALPENPPPIGAAQHTTRAHGSGLRKEHIMKISNVGEGELHFTETEAKAAMLACGFDESSLDDMEILAARLPAPPRS